MYENILKHFSGKITTGELGYEGPLYDRFLHMTDNRLGPSPMHIKYLSYVYDRFCIWRTTFPGPIVSVISKFTCMFNILICLSPLRGNSEYVWNLRVFCWSLIDQVLVRHCTLYTLKTLKSLNLYGECLQNAFWCTWKLTKTNGGPLWEGPDQIA